jgi:hypothetical protein
MNKLKAKRTIFFVVLIIFLMALFYRIFENYRDKKLLLSSAKEIGILTQIHFGAVKSPKSGNFIYKVKGVKYSLEDTGDFTFMKIGDTVLIEYSLKDPSVARVVDKCYMQKYKGKCSE